MAVRFDAATDRYQDTTADGLPGATFTITLWFRREVTLAGYQFAWALENAVSSAGSYIGIGTAGNSNSLVLFKSSGDATIGTISNGTWYKLALVVNGSTCSVWWGPDGGALTQATLSSPGAPAFTRAVMWLASDSWGEWWNGSLASVKVWNAALTQAEVAAELGSYAPVRTDGLLRRHDLTTAPGTADDSGNGHAWAAGSTATATATGPSSLVSGTAYTATLVDTIGITDTLASSSATSRALVDTVGIADTLASSSASARSLVDPVAVTDTTAPAAATTRDLVDPVAVTDVVGFRYSRELTDSVGITDTVAQQADTARALVDPVGIADPLTRAHAASRALTDELAIGDALDVVEVEPPGGEASTLTPDLYAVDWAGDGRLTRLPAWVRVALSPVRNDVGALSVDYPQAGAGFDVLDAGVAADPPRVLMVEVRLGGSAQGRRRGFLVQKRADDKLTASGVVRFDGHDTAWLLDKALVAPQPKSTANPKGELLISGLTYGGMLQLVVDQAQDRPGVLPGVSLSFTASHDSNGDPWAETITNLKIAPKTTVLDVCQKGVELGAGEFWVDDNLTLHAVNPGGRGRDLTTGPTPLVFAHAVNLAGYSQRESAKDAASAVLAAGGEGVYAWAQNATAEASLGFRAEAAVDAGNIDNTAAVLAYAQGQAEILGTGLAEYQTDVELTPTGLRPLLNYDVGDWGTAVVGTRRRRLRIAQVAVEWVRGSSPRVTVAQNDLVSDALAALIRRMKRLAGGDAVIGTSAETPQEDLTVPTPPTGLVVSSETYLEGVDYLAAVTAGWTPPALNTDGSALTDLAGYRLQYRYATQAGIWTDVDVEDTQAATGGFSADPGKDIVVRVAALDSSGHVSAMSDEVAHTTAKDEQAPPTPSAPGTSSRLLVGYVSWDGVGAAGEAMPVDLLRAQVHLSPSQTFTADATTRRTDALEGIPPGGGTFPLLGLPPGSVWWVALVAEDKAGNLSQQTASVQLTVSRAIADDIADQIIDAAKLADGAVTSPAIAPEAVRTQHLTVASFTDNRLPNGGMEDPDLVDPALPAGWSLGAVTDTLATLARDTDPAHVASGSAAARVSLASAAGTAQLLSAAIPVAPGDVWYVEASARADRAVATALSVRVLLGADDPPTVEQQITGAQGLSLGTAYTEVPPGGGNLAVPATVAGAAPRWMRLLLLVGGVAGDAGALEVWVDEVRARLVVGTAEIANAAISRAKIANLAVGAAQVEYIAAGQISTGTLSAVVTLSGEFRTASSGRRMVINGNGYEAYKADGTTLFAELDLATETMLMTGTYRSALAGERINMLPDGTLRFYQATGSNYAQIANNEGPGTGPRLTMRGALDGNARSGTFNVTPNGAGFGYGPPTAVGPESSGNGASMSVTNYFAAIRAAFMGIRIEDRMPADSNGRRLFILATDSSGNDKSDSILQWIHRPAGGPMWQAPTNDSGLVLNDGVVIAVNAGGEGYQRLVALGFDSTSSETLKEQIGPVTFPGGRTALDIVRGAPARDFYYIAEGKRPARPDATVRRRRKRPDGTDAVDANGRPVFDEVPAEFTHPPRPRKKHRFPTAEDLLALDPELVGTHGLDGDLTVDLRDMLGVLWAAVGELAARLDPPHPTGSPDPTPKG